MPKTVIYDACVLYPAPLRDLLIRLGMSSLSRARWTDRILDEVFRNLLSDRPDLTEARLLRTRKLMNAAIRDVLVEGYDERIEELVLPDADDRHVLAAAIEAGAEQIVTWNLRDFPAEVLAVHGIAAVDPDEFVCGLLDDSAAAVVEVLERQASALRSPPMSAEELLAVLKNNGLVELVRRVRDLRGR